MLNLKKKNKKPKNLKPQISERNKIDLTQEQWEIKFIQTFQSLK